MPLDAECAIGPGRMGENGDGLCWRAADWQPCASRPGDAGNSAVEYGNLNGCHTC